MQTDVIELTTSDGVRLAGGYFPARGQSATAPVDAVLLNPGTSGTFYSSPIFPLANQLAGRGIAALTLSTRGHDIVFRDQGGKRYLGSAYELVEDCLLDFDAALGFLERQGHRRVALIGHSLGGVKVLYYVAQRQDPRVVASVSLSGPRWSASFYLDSERAADFQTLLDEAKRLVDAGTPDALMEHDFPAGPTLRTAAGYLEKYAGEKYNQLAWCEKITVPVLRVSGELETSVVQRGIGDELLAKAVHSPHRQAVELPGMAHAYTPAQVEHVAGVIVNWFQGLPQ